MAVGITCVCEGQTPKRVFRPKKIDSTKNTKLRDLLKLPPTKPVDTLSTPEVVAGLKQALSIGVNNGTGKLGMLDGFFGNAMIKVLLPPEAQKLETTLRSLGFNKMVDDAILSMNRAAEDAAKTAAPLFLDAVSRITIEDAFGILLGADTAATGYLRSRTLQPLTAAFRPIVETSLGKVNATKNWTALATLYNKVARQRVNPDLAGFVTERATAGIFYQLGQEEKEIRKNPLARVTSLLQKVFTPR
ncbi:MAG: DUF4197 domain-containing protein [Bacteroidetes bacterium]|nr:MAG: DUF4197 domain-containing protein [Bacteroidota bacterium]